jgi:hypothetical protein
MNHYNIASKDSESARRARDIMQAQIDKGRASAINLLEYVHNNVPNDFVSRGVAFNFEAHYGEESPLTLTLNQGGASAETSSGLTIHKHALNQLATKAGIPALYLKDLVRAPEAWKRDLAAKSLNDFYQNDQADQSEDLSTSRHLVRVVNQDVRAVLSDRYRRLDSRPLVDAFADECKALDAVPIEGTVTDVRVALKALLPMVFEPVPGEVMCLGIEWSNSDFGAGKHAVRAFIYRLWCLNGATMEDVLSQVHLGGRLAEGIEFSDRTYKRDTIAQVSALRDVVKGSLGPKSVNTLLDTIKSANDKQLDWKTVSSKLSKKLLKEELKSVRDAFESDDVINLPPQKSLWRASNAISWIAGHTEDADRKLELQRLAGEVIHGKVEVVEAA